VAPGYISTDIVAAVPQEALDKVIASIPVGRLGEPEEIALRSNSLPTLTPASSPTEAPVGPATRRVCPP